MAKRRVKRSAERHETMVDFLWMSLWVAMASRTVIAVPPSFEHEAWVMLVQNRPELAAELVRDVLGLPLPSYREVALTSEDATEVVPASKRADAVVVLRSQPGRRPVMAVVVEVQRDSDIDKRFSWPVYLALVRARLRCPAMLLVLCPNAAAARWCSQSIEIGHPHLVLKPLVCDVSLIPVITEPKEAAQSPEMAVLSAIAHGADPEGPDVLRAVLSAIADLDDHQAIEYADMVLKLLPGEAAKHLWEDMMKTRTYEFQSDFARRYIAEGKAEGKAEGMAQGKAEDVVRILVARGFAVSAELRDTISAIGDVAVLDGLIERAVVCETPETLL